MLEEARRWPDGVVRLPAVPQENDAERAVQAALAIQRALSDLNNQECRRERREAVRAASALGPGRLASWKRPARCSATRQNVATLVPRPRPSLAQSSSPSTRSTPGRGAFCRSEATERAQKLRGRVSAWSSSSRRSRQRRWPKGWRKDASTGLSAARRNWDCPNAPPGAHSCGRRPTRACRRRARPRQVAAHRGVPFCAVARGTPHAWS